MGTVFSRVRARSDERVAARAGDAIVAGPDVVMNRGFTLAAPPEAVWPWLAQLGKRRAGWYLPASVERFLPPSHRGARRIGPAWQRLRIGDVIPDYGGREATFEVVVLNPPRELVYRSRRGDMTVSWSIMLSAEPRTGPDSTRVHLRLRLGPVRRRWLAKTGGELLDVLTVVALAAGLRERVGTAT
jgi:hypothetical protein